MAVWMVFSGAVTFSLAGSDSNGKGTAGVRLGAALPHGLVSYCSCMLSFLKIIFKFQYFFKDHF